MNSIYITFFCLLFLIKQSHLKAQQQTQKLSLTEAIKTALENNYDIKIATQDVMIAENNASILNSGFILPTLSANSNLDYSKTETKVTPANTFRLNGGGTSRFSGQLNLQYTILNLYSIYNFAILKQRFKRSEIELRQMVENTLTDIYTNYYQIALLTEKESALIKTLERSQRRLTRIKYNYEYGQSLEIDVLRAEVDLNKDSTEYTQNQLLLHNSKRSFKMLLGIDEINSDFEVDTLVAFSSFSLPELLDSAVYHSSAVQKADQDVSLNELTIKGSQYFWVPVLSAYLRNSYQRSGFTDDPQNRTALTNSTLSGGISLSWNIFDGGKSIIDYQNAKISMEKVKLQKQQTLQRLKIEMNNVWQEYQNALFILKSQQKNLSTSQRAYDKAEEQLQIGQISSVDFRTIQVDQLNARLLQSQAKYNAKNAEIKLLRLAGILVK